MNARIFTLEAPSVRSVGLAAAYDTGVQRGGIAAHMFPHCVGGKKSVGTTSQGLADVVDDDVNI